MTVNHTRKLLTVIAVFALVLVAAPLARAQDQAEQPFDASITTQELFDKAREAFGLDKLGLAETFFQEILIRDPANVQAMLELSKVYERDGKLEYALGLLTRAAKLEPENKTIGLRHDSVEQTLQMVLTEEVDSLIAGRHYELAIPKLSTQIGINPDDSELLYKKALCYTKLGRTDAALAALDNAVKIKQEEKYYKLRGAIVESLKLKEARELVTQAKQLLGSDVPADREKAFPVLSDLLQIDPENEWAKIEISRLNGGAAPEEALRGENGGKSTGFAVVTGFVRTAAGKANELLTRHLSAFLVFLTVLIVFRSPLTRVISKIFFPQPVLSGRFPRFSLSEVLLMLNAEYHTGVLYVKGESCRGKIYVENGEPCHASVGKIKGIDALAHLLDKLASGSFYFSDGSIPLNRTIDTPLSIILVERASVSSQTGPGNSRNRGDGEPPSGGGPSSKKLKSRMKELLDSKIAD